MATDYYEVLGVGPDADIDVIKRQYRILVRQNHPDIAPDKESAHQRMQSILEAWNVLSDPAERARYDRSRQPTVMPGVSAPPTTGRADQGPLSSRVGAPGSTSAPGRVSGQVGTARPTGRQSRPAPAGGATNPRTRLLTMVFEAAQLYFSEGRADEAIKMCEQVMKADPSSAEAPALLGDIYAEQGQRELALLMYERAMIKQPHNLLYRQKRDSLKNAAPGRSSGAGGYSPPAAARTRSVQKSRGDTHAKRAGCGARILLWLALTGAVTMPLGWMLVLMVRVAVINWP